MQKIKELLKLQGASFALSLILVIFAILFTNTLYHEKAMIKRGFQVEISADGKPVAKKEEKLIDLATMMKTADFDRGAKIFKKCMSCHSIGKGEAAKVGPNLYGIVGRARGSFAGFSYSAAMKAKGGSWDAESINQFITKPKDYLPGTKMGFAGLKKPQDRADVILYLQRQK
ncbi:MAG: cytochrome c family protein [Proteobacteria bacterium]|nr:cytochrome c family protein [Pseudomonadota bacterium]